MKASERSNREKPSIHPIQNPPLVVEPEKYTCEEFQTALLALENFWIARGDREAMKRIAASLPDKIMRCTMKCIELGIAERKATTH